MSYNKRMSYFITGRSSADSWYKAMQVLNMQTEIPAGDDFGGRDSMTKDMNLIIELDEEAVDEIVAGEVHPAFETRKQGRDAYDFEFTYFFVYSNWHMDEKMKFVYNYMDRFLNYPKPKLDFIYQGNDLEVIIPEEYDTIDPYVAEHGETGGFDQLKWLHDKIREDGISRRHQIITWIPVIDCFNTSPPCLQRIFLRVLVPKSEWHKYKGCIPVEVHIDYRSWDVGRALPSNLYGLFNMIYRYVCGNLTQDTEFITEHDGQPVRLLDIKRDPLTGIIENDKGRRVIINKDVKPDFKIVRAVLFGDAAHMYESAYSLAKDIKPANSPSYKQKQ